MWASLVALTCLLCVTLQGCGGGSTTTTLAPTITTTSIPSTTTTLAPIVGSCGGSSPSSVKDCQNVDFGSCGNACCNLMINVPAKPANVVQRLQAALAHGGPDGGFTLQTTADQSLFYDNLTAYVSKLPAPFHSSATGVYIAQVHHMTSGPKHYNDTINFNLYGDGKGGTNVRAFSLSLIGGALGDNGQGYKNIMLAMDAAFPIPVNYSVTHLDGSCAAATSPPALRKTVLPTLAKTMPQASTALPGQTAAVVGSCGGTSPSKVKDCQNVDFGSCGNACCNLLLRVPTKDPSAVIRQLDSSLADGGPDGDYTLQITASGDVFYSNLSAYVSKLPAPFHSSKTGVYIAQAHHMTSGPKHYNDTVNFNLYGDGQGGTVIHAFSLSLIGGALGDNGQGYKNIAMAMEAAFPGSRRHG